MPRADGSKAGRPAFDQVLMFKILLLQAMHTLSDERCEYLIRDRLSFLRFVGIGLGDPAGHVDQLRWAQSAGLNDIGSHDRPARRDSLA